MKLLQQQVCCNDPIPLTASVLFVYNFHGSLLNFLPQVWAQMSKYPFWPAIIVHSYEGSFSKYTFAQTEVYCQFVGWNSAGAWVKRVLPWQAYHEIETKPFMTASERRLW